MKTKYFIFAAMATTMFASCTSEDFVGNTEAQQSVNESQSVINFSGGSQAFTRSSNDDIAKLNGQFIIYGVKKSGDALQKVFENYWLWNQKTADPNTTTNTEGWEYVGANGTSGLGEGNLTLTKDQTIKFWDYTATEYRFVAGSPVDKFTYTVDANNNITGATVEGITGHIEANPKRDAAGNEISNETSAPLSHEAIYIADPVIVGKTTGFKQPVNFNFKGQQALVRVGIYETIPGYEVTEIKFYTYNASTGEWTTTTTNNVVLNATVENFFLGGTNLTATLVYTWTPSASYTFSYNNAASLASNKWYGGQFRSGVPATSKGATETNGVANLYGEDKDMAAETGYFPVLPTQTNNSNSSALLIKCDYTLRSTDGSNETIKVTGAQAAIPAAFSRWKTNYAYTYLFKISDNTGGTTGDIDQDDPQGLFPIVFDAVVAQVEEGNKEGLITTVSAPSISSYQPESPTTTGIKYVTNKDIYVTVQNNTNGDLKELKALNNASPAVGMIKVYKLDEEKQEADLQITRPTVSGPTTEIPATAWNTIPANKYMKFKPTATGYYAVEYINSVTVDDTDPANPVKTVSYTYKVIHVVEE